MRGHRVWLSLLVLIGLLLAPSLASAAPFRAEELLTASALVDTSQNSRYVVTNKGVSNLYCDADVTVITGGGSVKFQLFACLPDEIAEDGCVDETDGLIWIEGTSLSSADADRIIVLPTAAVGNASSMSDIELVAPVPAVWMVRMVETGSTTLTYTVDCMWW